jgi:hypothetical protein
MLLQGDTFTIARYFPTHIYPFAPVTACLGCQHTKGSNTAAALTGCTRAAAVIRLATAVYLHTPAPVRHAVGSIQPLRIHCARCCHCSTLCICLVSQTPCTEAESSLGPPVHCCRSVLKQCTHIETITSTRKP